MSTKPDGKPFHVLRDYGSEGWAFWSGHNTAEEALTAAMDESTGGRFLVVKIIEFAEVKS